LRADQSEDLAPAGLGDCTEHGFHGLEYKQSLTLVLADRLLRRWVIFDDQA
jgi:hypothetical protein